MSPTANRASFDLGELLAHNHGGADVEMAVVQRPPAGFWRASRHPLMLSVVAALSILVYCFTLWPIPTQRMTTTTPHSALRPHVATDYPYYREPVIPSTTENDFEGIWARAWTPWPRRRQLACPRPVPNMTSAQVQERVPVEQGLVLVRPLKTGSSTALSVHTRLGRNRARKVGQEDCNTRYHHASARRIAPQRDREHSLLWSVIRDPTRRLVSLYFYQGMTAEDADSFLDYIKDKVRHGSAEKIFNHYLRRLAINQDLPPGVQEMTSLDFAKSFPPFTPPNVTYAAHIFNEYVMKEYDFIAVTERMDESMVAMSLLFHIPLGDVLYLKPGKTQGGWAVDPDSPTCRFIAKGSASSDMQSFFRTDQWQEMTRWDIAMYRAADRSLDLTIEALGAKRFQATLNRYQTAMKEVERRCVPKVPLPCSPDGVFTNQTDCMYLDCGCGNSCIDEVARDLGIDR